MPRLYSAREAHPVFPISSQNLSLVTILFLTELRVPLVTCLRDQTDGCSEMVASSKVDRG